MNRKLLYSGILRTLARFKLRTFFMSLGIVLGVAVLVAAVTMGTAAQAELQEKVDKMFSADNVFLSSRGGELTLDDMQALTDEVPDIEMWEPFHMLGGQDVTAEGTTRQIYVHGFGVNAERIWHRYVAVGEPISAADVASSARVALLGPTTARALFGDGEALGREIRVGSVAFRVQGILEPFGIDPHGLDRDDEVHVPITTMMRRLQNTDTINGAKLLVHDADRAEASAERIAAVLRERHAIADGEDDDFALFTSAAVRGMVARANRVVKVFIPSAAGIVLLVATIIIANVMLASVRERIPEIGLRKAVGATPRQIRTQFLLEAVAVTFFSGLLGIVLGTAAMVVTARTMGTSTIVTPGAILIGLAAALAAGVLAGYFPARRAAGLDPVTALS